jgi:hypothetical protein
VSPQLGEEESTYSFDRIRGALSHEPMSIRLNAQSIDRFSKTGQSQYSQPGRYQLTPTPTEPLLTVPEDAHRRPPAGPAAAVGPLARSAGVPSARHLPRAGSRPDLRSRAAIPTLPSGSAPSEGSIVTSRSWLPVPRQLRAVSCQV